MLDYLIDCCIRWFQETERLFNGREDKLEIENNRLNRKPAADDSDEMDDAEVEEVDSDEWDEDEADDDDNPEDAIPPNDCLFCDKHSPTLEKVRLHNCMVDGELLYKGETASVLYNLSAEQESIL
jgi:hypothetical protein